MAVSYLKFIERLNRSGLLPTDELQSRLTEAPNDDRPGNAEALARWLVRHGHLTPFQAKAIYIGRTKGLVVGNYEILDLLGVGGMGQVYKARHRRMKRVVALKLLAPEVAQKPKLVQRFHQEVQAAARLMHPNIVTAFDADVADGKHFLVMEYVAGRDLASLVQQRGRFSVDRSIRCVLDAARGLEYAHQHGVVHRDVKPSNLLLEMTEDDCAIERSASSRVKILDMGLARIEAEAEKINAPADLTRTGIVMGTVDYMSPEQAVNTHDADHRSDIYSLGITLHYLLTGRVPFTGRTVIEQVLAHREAEIPTLVSSREDVPPKLDAIFRKMVAKNADDRYQSMTEVIADLEGVLSSDESASDLPVLIDDGTDDSALASFLDSMSGDSDSKRQAVAAVITPASPAEATLETTVTSNRSTAIDSRSHLGRRRTMATPWRAVAFHAAWSLGLLALAVWMLWLSRSDVSESQQPAAGAAEPAGEATAARAGIANSQEPLDRRFARWVVDKGGSVTVTDGTRSQQVLPGQDLPGWGTLLTSINLPGSAVAAEDLVYLKGVAKLELLKTLVLAGCPELDNDWIAALPPCERLVHLDVRGSSVSDSGLAGLSLACPMLEVLSLSGCPIDGSGLESLSRMPLLRRLVLSHTPVAKSALTHLRELKSLRELDLRETSLARSDLSDLRQALPNCVILPKPQ